MNVKLVSLVEAILPRESGKTDPEPLPADHPLRTLPNVVLTPHRAGGTQESYWRIGRALVDGHSTAGSPGTCGPYSRSQDIATERARSLR